MYIREQGSAQVLLMRDGAMTRVRLGVRVVGLQWKNLFDLLKEKNMCLERYSVMIIFFEDNHLIMFFVIVEDVLNSAQKQTCPEGRCPYSDYISILATGDQFVEDVFWFSKYSLHRLTICIRG